MARTDPQVNFRIPAQLNDLLKEAAARNGRTITAELVHRLERSFLPVAGDDKGLDLRMQLAGHREFSMSIVELLKREAKRLNMAKEGGADLAHYPNSKREPVPIDMAIARSAVTLDYYERQAEASSELLAEIAFLEASGAPMDFSSIQRALSERGINVPYDDMNP